VKINKIIIILKIIQKLQLMSIVVFLLITNILTLLIVPINLKANISYNLLKNKGQINFYFMKFKFLSLKLKFKRKYLLLTTKKGKSILIPFDMRGGGSEIEYIDLSVILFNKTTINTLKIGVNVGVHDDPFKTALIYGMLQVANTIILSILKTKKLATIVKNKINPVYNKDSGTIYISSSLFISLFDYIWGFVMYKLKIIKVGKRYETRR